jgi:hypothetical protein
VDAVGAVVRKHLPANHAKDAKKGLTEGREGNEEGAGSNEVTIQLFNDLTLCVPSPVTFVKRIMDYDEWDLCRRALRRIENPGGSCSCCFAYGRSPAV